MNWCFQTNKYYKLQSVPLNKVHDIVCIASTITEGPRFFTSREDMFFSCLKPQDSLGRFVKIFLDLQKVDHIYMYHQKAPLIHRQLFWMTCCNVIIPNNRISLCILPMAECLGGPRTFWYFCYNFLTNLSISEQTIGQQGINNSHRTIKLWLNVEK